NHGSSTALAAVGSASRFGPQSLERSTPMTDSNEPVDDVTLTDDDMSTDDPSALGGLGTQDADGTDGGDADGTDGGDADGTDGGDADGTDGGDADGTDGGDADGTD